MSEKGRYVNLHIATPMCSSELGVVTPLYDSQSLVHEALNR